MKNTYEKLQKLMNSYVPEFAYKKGQSDPGSVLTDLCGDMIEESEKRYERVMGKHRIQYLNLFDAMLKEPVSAARGYVQFHPIAGYEGMVYIPKGTQVLAEHEEYHHIVFETEHDMTAVDAVPEIVAVTDSEKDIIVVNHYDAGAPVPFYAFDIHGENKAAHKMYFCFEQLFAGMHYLDLFMNFKAVNAEDQEELLSVFASDKVCWSVLESDGTEKEIPQVTVENGSLHLLLPSYEPMRAKIGEKEGYVLCVSAKETAKPLYIESMKVWFSGEKQIVDKIYLNGMEETAGVFLPFGKPLGLYQEFSFEDCEVLNRRGAYVQMKFHLSYRYYEEKMEIPEYETEYKPIMKKPRKPMAIQPVEVSADYVVWEYLSNTGWKRLFQEESVNTLFNGSTEGAVVLNFICPEDLAEYEEGTGRIRARLLRAEHIYQMPAVYRCPVISGFELSYSYKENVQSASYAATENNFEIKDVTNDLKNGGNVVPFYQTEHRLRAMYLGFQAPVCGTPFSLYFDIENYSDYPVDFRVEYLSAQGFLPLKVSDHTEGFTGSGNQLFVIPDEMKKQSLFGYEGYFLRFLCQGDSMPEYAVPLIKGIYPNMARVINVNRTTEEFYLQNTEDALDIQLNQQNLLDAKVWVNENVQNESRFVPWKKAEKLYEEGRSYQIDYASGVLHFRRYAFSPYDLVSDGPHIRVEHTNYKGSKANLEAGSIQTLGTSIRYISRVSNPFPTYGGYDGYTEESCMNYVTGLLRTRNRAVTNRDFYDIISQTAYGIKKIRCCNHVDALGRKKNDSVTIAVLIEEYKKGSHVFSEVKKQIRERLLKDSTLYPMGRELTLIQPHFIRLNVRVWIEKETMEQAYDLQMKANEMINHFIDPLQGGQGLQGWEIGEFPRANQIIAYLRTGIPGCNISKILMTAEIDGKEVPVTEGFYERIQDPFIMAVNGEHKVYIEVSGC